MKPVLLVLTSTFPRDANDYEPRFVADLCLHLKDDFEIHVLTQHRPGTPENEVFEEITVKRFRYAPERLEVLSESGGISNTLHEKRWAWMLVPFLIISQIFAIRKQIKKTQPDFIHSHWLFPQTLAAVLAIKTCARKPKLVSTSHGADVYSLRNKICLKLKKWIIKNTDTFCVVSHPMKQYVAVTVGIEADKIHVCPMGANIDDVFVPGVPENRNSKQLLYIGRLVQKKGVKYLLNALSTLKQKNKSFKLVIAGYGPEEANLKALTTSLSLERNVEFRGSSSHLELAALCKESETAIFPFIESENGDTEGLGLVLIEAMGTKCPIIAGDVPSISDLVVHNETGIVCDPTDTELLANNILKSLNDHELSQQMAESAYDFVHSKYSWPVCAARYKAIFSSLGSHNELQHTK